jgi:hypothetical protein
MQKVRQFRIIAGVVLAALLVFYTWFAFRDDGRLKTVPGVPQPVWFYFDHHSTVRNGVGFLILGFVGAAAVAGVNRRWQVVSLGLCAAAPVIKDLAQDLFAPTRHLNCDATGLGILGALLGWGAAALLLRGIRAEQERAEDGDLRPETGKLRDGT